MDSKSHKLLQELNIALDKRALELNEEREILAKALQDYSAGMVLEKALNEVCIELTALEDQDAALYRQIIQETGKLCQLEEMVRHMLCHYLGSLTLLDSGRMQFSEDQWA